jgi:hypothetical protein
MYKLLLMTPDGEDYVIEGNDLTKDEVDDLSENMGSRWIFYPLHFVISDNGPGVNKRQRIIDAGDALSWAIGKNFMTVQKMLKDNPIIIE